MKFVESINQALHSLLEENEKIIYFGEDLSDPYGGAFKVSKGLSSNFPDQVMSTPISEAAMVGMAGGMAIGGLKPIVEIMFGDFITLGADQLLNHLLKYEWMYDNKVTVPVTIRATMGGRRGYGPTHSQSLEPFLSTLPLLKLYSPTHFHDPGKLLKDIVTSEKGIKIFCEYKGLYPKKINYGGSDGLSLRKSENRIPAIFLSNSKFDSPELLIISHGGNSLLVEKVMIELLMEYELPVQANLLAQIKPLDLESISNGIEHSSTILILEESIKSFGWGAEVLAILVDSGLANGKKIVRVGAEELPIPSSIELEQQVLPSKEQIIRQLRKSKII